MKIVIANSNPIHSELENRLQEKYNALIIHRKDQLNLDQLIAFQPDYIFFPHWSFIIPSSIYNQFECIVFHMTDLPYGRGGSPLQNLIVNGHQQTKISALRVAKGMDTGPIYLKKDLQLLGTAEEIFLRAGRLISEMIDEIISNKIAPIAQEGQIVSFKRRKPHQGNIASLTSLEQIHNYIRMLDAPGYPNAFLETDHFKIEFSRASLKNDKISADVRIIKK